ncbi:MAG: DNA replication/repair protein RecF [Lutisporaceae bacterium]
MYIKRIDLKNFRNYKETDIELGEGVNVFYGRNAQGKTNIIESVYMASTGKSHRTQKDMELIRWNSEDAKITIDYKKEEEERIEIYLSKRIKKQIRKNGVRISKIGDLIGNLNAVIFSPDHMKIIKEGPVERRRFIDIILSQVKPGYYYNLVQYLRTLEQRNNLLNEAGINTGILKTIDIWNEQLADFGAKIIRARQEFICKICCMAADTHKRISNEKEKLDIKYNSSIKYHNNSEKEIRESFIKVLENYIKIDLKRGITHKGPHRDDILFFINGAEVKTYSSQGQQRTTLLSLKISELKYMKEETGELPVLLLDDVFSELDKERQKYLIEFIKDMQTIITCTNVEYFERLINEEVKVFKVEEGIIEKE